MITQVKISLVNLPWRTFGKTGVRAGSRWPHLKGPTEKDYLPFPFFLAYSASLLRKNGFQVKLIDAVAEGLSYGRFMREISKDVSDILVCETSTVTLEHDLRLLERLGNKSTIVLCGPDINIRQTAFLEKYGFIDYVLVGEYEFTLLELVRRLSEGRDPADVLGLLYRDPHGVKVTPLRPLLNPDELPWPLREGLPMHRYNDAPGDMPIPSVQMLASRGCPYKCNFCLWPQVMYQGNSYRTRSVEDVAAEMEYLVKEMGFKSVYFDDDTFNCGKDRMLRLSEEIRKRKISVPWAIMARADLMDEEILQKLLDAGLFAVKYGIESASQFLLDKIGKNMDIKKTIENVRLTKKLGIKTHLTFTFGLSGDTKETIRDTIELALMLDPTSVQFSLVTPFPGTRLYQEMKDAGRIVSENWCDYDGNHKSVISYGHLSGKDLETAIKTAYRQWLIHCGKRTSFKKFGYFQLLDNSLRKHGVFITFVKVCGFFQRRFSEFLREKLFYKGVIKRKIRINGIKVGKLILLFENGGMQVSWDGINLTSGPGFTSSLNLSGADHKQEECSVWEAEKVAGSEFILSRQYRALSLSENWRIRVLDEKQIEWEIDVVPRQGIEGLSGVFSLILSSKYRTWMDSWGEGLMYPFSICKDVELRNPRSRFVGLKGRKKFKGQLPTILLESGRDRDPVSPAVKNSGSIPGARVLEMRTTGLSIPSGNGSGGHTVFSGRIKIVVEDFNKPKNIAVKG